MGKYKQGILGPFMGKVGQVIGRVWNGIYYMAAVPSAVKNPNTNLQRRVRARFAKLGRMAQQFRSAILLGFKGVKKMTVYDRFVQLNWPQVTAIGPDSVEVNYGMLQCAQGKLAGIVFGAVDYGETQHLTISVAMDGTSGSGMGADADDDVYLFAYCPDLEIGTLSAPVKRSATAVTLSLPNNWDGQTVHVYGFARSSAANAMGPDICSDSAYCGSGEIQ